MIGIKKFLFFLSIGNPRWPPPEDKLNIGSHGENVLNLLLSKI